MPSKTIVIAGGGAAGFFAALNIAELHPDYRVIILEKSPKLLEKVRISGGGRCNVTHACFDPSQLVKFYPRGERELLGPFMRFNPAKTVDWFRQRGITLKTEDDDRMFPLTDSSETITNCFTEHAKKLHVEVNVLNGVDALLKQTSGRWLVTTNRVQQIKADAVIITTGSAAKMWQILENLGHSVVPPAPSLFTFNIKDPRIEGLSGVSIKHVKATVKQMKLNSEGPLLITHWGLSGPAILRLSAWGARLMQEAKHQFEVQINFSGIDINEAEALFEQYRLIHPKRQIQTNALFNIPDRLWKKIIPERIATKTWQELGKKDVAHLIDSVCRASFQVTGKSMNKDEFVTAGGIALKDVDFRTMQSKLHPGLFFAGEVLNIDAITGGFNFQAAWTTAWIAAQSV